MGPQARPVTLSSSLSCSSSHADKSSQAGEDEPQHEGVQRAGQGGMKLDSSGPQRLQSVGNLSPAHSQPTRSKWVFGLQNGGLWLSRLS